MPNNEFNQIKQALVDEIKGIRKDMDIFMKTVNVHDITLYGNRTENPPSKGKLESFDERIKSLEKIELDRIKIKNDAIKMAIGSATIAIGGAVIWVINVLRDAFIKH